MAKLERRSELSEKLYANIMAGVRRWSIETLRPLAYGWTGMDTDIQRTDAARRFPCLDSIIFPGEQQPLFHQTLTGCQQQQLSVLMDAWTVDDCVVRIFLTTNDDES